MRDSRGSISALVVSLVTTFAVLTGLALDGGRVVNCYVQLSDVAENAARLGAQNIVGIRAGDPRVDVERASQVMDSFLSAHSLIGQYKISGTSIEIQVSQRLPMTTLKLVGVSSRQITVRRTVSVLDG